MNRKAVPFLSLTTVCSWIDVFTSIQANAKKLDYPACFFYGTDDKVVSVEAIKSFFIQIRNPHKMCFTYNNQKHELQYEETKQDFFRDMLSYCALRLKQNPKPLG